MSGSSSTWSSVWSNDESLDLCRSNTSCCSTYDNCRPIISPFLHWRAMNARAFYLDRISLWRYIVIASNTPLSQPRGDRPCHPNCRFDSNFDTVPIAQTNIRNGIFASGSPVSSSSSLRLLILDSENFLSTFRTALLLLYEVSDPVEVESSRGLLHISILVTASYATPQTALVTRRRMTSLRADPAPRS